jgi:hypothetical protein
MKKRMTQKNQGEGNREADKQYRKGATNFANSSKQGRAAKEAKREVEQQRKQS